MNLRKRRSQQQLLNTESDEDEKTNEQQPLVKREWVRIGTKFFHVRRPQEDTWMCTLIEVWLQ